jgi:hypothetical protein
VADLQEEPTLGAMTGTGVSGPHRSARVLTVVLAAGSAALTLLALTVSFGVGDDLVGGLVAVALWIAALALAAMVVALTRRHTAARLLAWALVAVTAVPLVPLVVAAL